MRYLPVICRRILKLVFMHSSIRRYKGLFWDIPFHKAYSSKDYRNPR